MARTIVTMRTFTWRRAALASFVAVTMAGLATSPALAGEKPTPIDEGLPKGAELHIAQGPLLDLANRVADTDPERAHLGGIQLDVPQRAVHIYWNGAISDDVYRMVEEARDNGIDATLEEARYPLAEITKAQQEVYDKREAYPGLTSIGRMPDGSGLRIGATDPEALRSDTFPLEATIVREEPPTAAGRQDDTAPFWAGGAARPGSGGFCSTGFAVAHYNFWGRETDRGLLTADHCAPGGNVSYFTGSFKFMGTAGPSGWNWLAPLSDTQYIQTSSAARVFSGGVTSSTTRSVWGTAPLWPGAVVCTSGASTGEHCANVVYAVMSFSILTSGAWVLGVDYAWNTAVASGTGDSGGPVYALAPWNPAGVALAAGMIDNGSFGVTCASGSLTSVCFHSVGFVDIHYALVAQNARLLTS
jgi:hypothetical protein